jgi:RNA polymerase sigma-54 factor
MTDLELRGEQKQIASQRMYQQMRVLALGGIELSAYLEALALENPLLDAEPPQALYRPFELRTAAAADEETLYRAAEQCAARRGQRLEEYLTEQIDLTDEPDEVRTAARLLTASLDHRGWLAETEEPDSRWPAGLFARALALLQSLDPPGIGARSLSECLLLQLRRAGEPDDALACRLARDWMDALAHGQIARAARGLGVTAAEVERARARLAQLTPKPANGFPGAEEPAAVIPDVELIPGETGLIAVAADRYYPAFSVNGYYAGLLGSTALRAEERLYIRDRLAAAQWALACVERRRTLLVACAQAAADRQHGFFSDPGRPLLPLSVREEAAALGVHPSTVYRVLQGKYLACAHGVYPLAHFYARPAPNAPNGAARDSLVRRLTALIAAEDPTQPLNDEALAARLAAEGFAAARRTVAKYREDAGIPAAAVRRNARRQ